MVDFLVLKISKVFQGNLSKFLHVDLLTCGSAGHGLVLRWCSLPRLVHIDIVHR